MRVVLRENIENLGRKGDIVDVAPGYGRNYLIPKKLALELTSSNMKMIEMERKALKKRFEQERLSYQELIQKLNDISLTISRKSGEKDIIFGSVSAADIKEALAGTGFEIDKKKILLEEPIKRLGNYTVPIKIFHEDRAEIKVEVIREEEAAQKEEVPEEKKKDLSTTEAKEEKTGRKQDKEEVRIPEEKVDAVPTEESAEVGKKEKESGSEEKKKKNNN